MKNLHFLFLCLSVLFLHLVCASDEPSPDRGDDPQLYYIKNIKTGKVLDAYDFVVRLQDLIPGDDFQLWELKHIAGGYFSIRNEGNDKVLDIKDNIKTHHKIITYEDHNGENQRWNIEADGLIVSGEDNGVLLAIEINEDGEAVAEPRNKERNQIFELIEQDKIEDPDSEEENGNGKYR